MAAELGKSIHEAERDIAAQKELYAAFLQLMTELLKSIPGFGDRIDIQKGQGLTIERKPKGQAVEDVVEVDKKVPDAIQQEPSFQNGIETLYGKSQNNLTPNDIKAIAAIVRSNRGDSVVGGENLIIKYNGKTLFETDERGQIFKHTAVSPEIKEKFALLQAGKLTPAASLAQEVVSPSTPQTQAVSEEPEASEEKPVENKISLPPDFNTGEKAFVKQVTASQEFALEVPDTIIVEPPIEVERKVELQLQQVEEPNIEPVKVVTLSEAPTAEPAPEVEQEEPTEQVGRVKSALNNVGSYIVDRAKRDSETVATTAIQMVSNLGANAVSHLNQGILAIPDQYTAIKTMLTRNVVAEEEPKLENSIDEFMTQVANMFDELQQEDPNLGLSANQVVNGIPLQEEAAFTIEPLTTPEQPIQAPEGIDNNEAISTPQPKPAQLETISLEDALRYMSQRDDGAVIKDGRGYNLDDSSFGKKLMTQIERGEVLSTVQAFAAREMLGKYHRQFAEGGVKLPTTKSVQEIYSPPAPPAVDQRAIFARQREKLDATEPIEHQQKVVAAAFKLYFNNLSEEQAVSATQPGITEIPLPTGGKLVNELSDLGTESISIEVDGQMVALGGRSGSNYIPASTYAQALPELRNLKPYLSEDLRLSPEPVNKMPLTQPLAIEQKEMPTADEPEPFIVPIHMELELSEEPAEEQIITRGRGGR